MSLSVYLSAKRMTDVYDANITHNCAEMARQAGIYNAIWNPNENGVRTAEELIWPLRKGLAVMKAYPDHFRTFEPENGWGTYDHFVPWIEEYLDACERYPDAEITVSR